MVFTINNGRRAIALLFGLVVAGAGSSAQANPTVTDFDSGTFSGWSQHECYEDSVTIVESPQPVRHGQGAMRAHMEIDWPWRSNGEGCPKINTNPRAELSFTSYSYAQGGEYWTGLSIYVPSDWVATDVALFQWHSTTLDDCDRTELPHSPQLSLRGQADGTWAIHNRYTTVQCWTQAGTNTQLFQPQWTLGNINKGQWTDFVLRTVFSHQDDGILQVWADGILVVDEAGPNHHNDPGNPYFKFGMYKSKWVSEGAPPSTMTVYFDEMRIYEGVDGYEQVAPPGSGVPATDGGPFADGAAPPDGASSTNDGGDTSAVSDGRASDSMTQIPGAGDEQSVDDVGLVNSSGCGGCSSTPGPRGDTGVMALLAMLATIVRRRRRRG